jgi:hypothetical protein
VTVQGRVRRELGWPAPGPPSRARADREMGFSEVLVVTDGANRVYLSAG